MTYPESEKALAVQPQTQIVGEFLEWLFAQGVRLMVWGTYQEPVAVTCRRHGRSPASIALCEHCDPAGMAEENRPREGFLTYSSDIQQILANWKGIDLQKIEREKRAMLAQLAEINGRA